MNLNELINGNNNNVKSDDKPKRTEHWANIGVETGNEKYPFISLPFGIPLDTQDAIQVRGSNEEFRQFTRDRNQLLELLKAKARSLSAGESCTVNLQVQLHKVAEENPEPTGEVSSFLSELEL